MRQTCGPFLVRTSVRVVWMAASNGVCCICRQAGRQAGRGTGGQTSNQGDGGRDTKKNAVKDIGQL